MFGKNNCSIAGTSTQKWYKRRILKSPKYTQIICSKIICRYNQVQQVNFSPNILVQFRLKRYGENSTMITRNKLYTAQKHNCVKILIGKKSLLVKKKR